MSHLLPLALVLMTTAAIALNPQLRQRTAYLIRINEEQTQ